MAKGNLRRGKQPLLATDIHTTEAVPTACGEPLERFLSEKDVRMSGVWFWRNVGGEELDGEADLNLFSVDNLFSGNMAMSFAVPPTKVAVRPARPVAGRIPVNPVYPGVACFRYAGPA